MEPQEKQWSIRPFRREDGTEVLNLLRNAFSKEFTPEWFQWRYGASLFGESILHVAESASAGIVGFRALWYWPLVFEGKEVPAYQVGDLVVHRDYRSRGIMLAFGKRGIEEAERRGVWLRFGFANTDALPGALKLGYQIVGHFRHWCRVFRRIRFFYNKLRASQRQRDIEPFLSDMDRRHFLPAKDHIHELVKLREKGYFSGLRSLRSEEFYAWRLSHPSRPCYLISLDGKTPLMMIHLQKERIGGRAFLMEPYVASFSSEWKAAMEIMHDSGKIDSIYTMASHPPEVRNLSFMRYKSTLSRLLPILIVQVLRNEARPFLSKDLWDFTPLDMDFY